ncbi:unnamed protein product [Didymodactylos carnosus]|uniref:Uncharacterized protein n=1 Tax=Didymodactylos carnosus TaxID=1234261 RepID=A0A814WDE2_9BILA|nr:unnamed protein product [Didymodactylos carnosus]CAF1199883.1 unnamed protein product [Didymodactylos carnosus]CAF3828751.1 unnamed protein product [Didymodactylos carnosus]CAF3964431.1 unnamed protein product [Didymodactylos carnosus]
MHGLSALDKQVFGYVDLGASTENLTVEEMKHAVHGWKSMGAKGIFWDDAGFDYRVTRERQSQMLDFCHELNLACIMNA